MPGYIIEEIFISPDIPLEIGFEYFPDPDKKIRNDVWTHDDWSYHHIDGWYYRRHVLDRYEDLYYFDTNIRWVPRFFDNHPAELLIKRTTMCDYNICVFWNPK